MGRPMLSKPELGLYWCSGCEALLEKDRFYRSSGRSTGVSNRCKPCSSQSAMEWALANPKRAQQARERHDATERRAEKSKEWRNKNRDRLSRYMSEWREDRSYCAFTRGKARANRAMPNWADANAIAALYEQARVKRETTGKDWHVDHIVPLNGVAVCGLHVENNLRVIPASENCSKRNKFVEDASA